MLERLPTPWGLVRLGVAPDHPKLKEVSRAFEKIALRPGFRFFGNVELGRDLDHDQLMQLYDGVIYAVDKNAEDPLVGLRHITDGTSNTILFATRYAVCGTQTFGY